MRGGFASYTKTGRNIAMGRRVGAAMARGTSSSGGSSSSRNDNNEEPTAFVKFMLVFTCLYIIHTINQILKQKQL
jgi:hypothetical protein